MSIRKTVEEVKSEFNNVQGDKYDYSLITDENYINTSTKLPIICHCLDEDGKEHGIFYQDRKHHLRGHGCPKCANSGIKYDNTTFIKKVENIYPSLDFSNCVYVNSHLKVTVKCEKHGEFNAFPYLLLQNHGCPQCAYEKRGKERRSTTEKFIEKARKVHGDKYDYSKVEYIKTNEKVCIICPKHGEFWQVANTHLNGCGCPICRESMLEKEVSLLFPFMEREKKFEWLIYQSNMRLDFYCQEKNIAIECQGEQHFIDKGLDEDFSTIVNRDVTKYNLCTSHNIEIIYYFPKEFLHDNTFYKNKICFYNKEDLKKYVENRNR